MTHRQTHLQVADVPAEQQLLAHCYAAEALCNLQSPQQAAQQLQTAMALQGMSGADPTGEALKSDGNGGQAHSPEASCDCFNVPCSMLHCVKQTKSQGTVSVLQSEAQAAPDLPCGSVTCRAVVRAL